MKINRVLFTCLLSVFIFSSATGISVSANSNKDLSKYNYITDNTKIYKSAKCYTQEQFNALSDLKKDKEIVLNPTLPTRSIVTPQWAYREVWDHYDPSRAYIKEDFKRLGSCKVTNNLGIPQHAYYSQQSTVALSASLTTTVSAHADAKLKVVEFGASVSTSVSLSATVTAGTQYAVDGPVPAYSSVTYTAYMDGVCVDGSAVYKVYDTSGFAGYDYKPANNNIILDPIDVHIVIS